MCRFLSRKIRHSPLPPPSLFAAQGPTLPSLVCVLTVLSPSRPTRILERRSRLNSVPIPAGGFSLSSYLVSNKLSSLLIMAGLRFPRVWLARCIASSAPAPMALQMALPSLDLLSFSSNIPSLVSILKTVNLSRVCCTRDIFIYSVYIAVDGPEALHLYGCHRILHFALQSSNCTWTISPPSIYSFILLCSDL